MITYIIYYLVSQVAFTWAIVNNKVPDADNHRDRVITFLSSFFPVVREVIFTFVIVLVILEKAKNPDFMSWLGGSE